MNSKTYLSSQFGVHSILHDYFEIGGLVKLKDNSYIINENKLAARPYQGGRDDAIYQIIDGNKAFPSGSNKYVEHIIIPINNMKIRNINTGIIYYCSPINCVSIMHPSNMVQYFQSVIDAKDILETSYYGNIDLLTKK